MSERPVLVGWPGDCLTLSPGRLFGISQSLHRGTAPKAELHHTPNKSVPMVMTSADGILTWKFLTIYIPRREL
jgi:hypothetical protein